jgi:membrane-bound lytic murein transglycosylase D
MFSVISVSPCEIISLQLQLDSFVKMGVRQRILAMGVRRLAGLLLAAIAATYSAGPPAKDARANLFPEPYLLSPAVNFWRRVYTEIDSASGFVHDNKKLDAIYGTLYLNPDAPPRAQNSVIEKTLGKYRRALLALASGKRHELTSIEKRALRTWGERASASELRTAARRVRFQRGQSDRILKGLTRYARWKAKIQAIFREQGLPSELVALPFVESSYDPRAVSKAGAVGLWQFMPAIARRYLRLDDQIDERLDPMKSSKAAAHLLQHNHSVLKSWPLAITAYNHGLSGVRRAVRETGTDDLGEIAMTYETGRFGFASRNFYAAFLAAVEVSSHPTRYFQEYRQNAKDPIALVTPAYLPVDVLVEGLSIDKDRLRALNPSLHHAVWNGDQFVPRGHILEVPGTLAASWAQHRLDKLAEFFGFSSQIPDPYYEVRLGDTLSEIAERYETISTNLLAMNQLENADDIYAGQILRVPMMSNPKPLGVGGAAMLAAQSVRGDIDGDSLGLPSMILALVDQGKDAERNVRVESPQDLLSADVCHTRVAHGSAISLPSSHKKNDETTAVFAEAQPDLGADPLDYSVAADGTIEIQLGETVGHYADWLQLPSKHISKLNALGAKAPLIVGRRLRLDFSNTSAALFEKKRISFHKSLQLRYLKHHRIKGIIEHSVIAGDNLWLLAAEQYGIPLWLIRQYNPAVGVDTVLSVGSVVLVPLVEALPDEPNCTLGQISTSG